MQKTIKTIFTLMLSILLITSSIVSVHATEVAPIETSSVDILFTTENETTPMENVNINIYQLATFDVSEDLVEWNELYANYIIDLARATDEEIIDTSAKIAEYIVNSKITPSYTIKTNNEGKANISFDNGIYLIWGEETIKNNITYTPIPCIIQMPYFAEGELYYNASIELKYDRVEPEPEEPTPEPKPEEPTPEPEQPPVQTGEENHNYGYVFLIGGLVVICLVGIGMVVVKKNKKEK